MNAPRTLPLVSTTVVMPADLWLRTSGYADTVGSSFSQAVRVLCSEGLDSQQQ